MENDQCCDQVAEILRIFHLILTLLWILPEVGEQLELTARIDCIFTVLWKGRKYTGREQEGETGEIVDLCNYVGLSLMLLIS